MRNFCFGISPLLHLSRRVDFWSVVRFFLFPVFDLA